MSTTASISRLRLAVLGIAAAVLVPVPASAQRLSSGQGFSVGVEGGYYDMTNASRSAKAIFGAGSGGPLFGLSARLGVGRDFFVQAGGRYFQRNGERVFVADPAGPVFPLGHPMKVRLVPVYAMFGWRISPEARLSPYVALGAGVTSYREESTVAGEAETFSSTKGSVHAAAGADFGTGSLRFGAELMYTMVPRAIGEAGVSKVYGETDVGGLSVVGRVSFGR